MKKVLAITPGDPEGIGYEITWKVLKSLKKIPFQLLCVGAREPFKKLKAPVIETDLQALSKGPPTRKQPFVWLLPAPEKAPEGRFLAGFQSGWSIEQATQLVLNGKSEAIVTGPISKERLQNGGYPYPGHTEFLAALCQASPPTMMLANSQLRVSLVTTHVGINKISQVLSREKIRKTVLHTAEGLRKFWGIRKPKIAVTALNPHAGEKGLFGNEEIDLIEPEVRSLQNHPDFDLLGPFPADTIFTLNHLAERKKKYDAVVCMYHDQGLIPVKLLDFHNTVNVTLGLPIIRTSVDHGTGFDIAGKGVANPSSMRAAIELAVHFVQKKGASRK